MISGSGNTVSSNPSGTGTSLNYVGDHAYGYSGAVAVANSDITLLKWNMGPQYLVGTFQPLYMSDANVNDDYYFRIEMDGEIIASVIIDGARVYSPYEEFDIIIPAYARIQVIAKNNESNTNNVGAMITGRVYR